MDRTIITSDAAPSPVGPYSQAVQVGHLIFTAGQVALNSATGRIEATTVEDQTHQVLRNLGAVLEAAGSGLDRVVKATVFMTDLRDFPAMNAVYGEYFPVDPPARSTVQVSALPLGVQVEIEVVATTR